MSLTVYNHIFSLSLSLSLPLSVKSVIRLYLDWWNSWRFRSILIEWTVTERQSRLMIQRLYQMQYPWGVDFCFWCSWSFLSFWFICKSALPIVLMNAMHYTGLNNQFICLCSLCHKNINAHIHTLTSSHIHLLIRTHSQADQPYRHTHARASTNAHTQSSPAPVPTCNLLSPGYVHPPTLTHISTHKNWLINTHAST